MVLITPKNYFTVLTYNIFAKSLGTNTIPWVMNVSPSIRDRIQAHAKVSSFDEWVDGTLKPEYLTHFHKNFESGNYAAMRQFWGAPRLETAEDIPTALTGLSWEGPDQVSYTCSSNQDLAMATTLRGMAKKSLPPDLFDDFFTEVVALEQNVYTWSIRGPRLFQTILKQGPPDIVALQEYDCHNVIADYRGPGKSETFAEAMAASGYDGAFCKDPLLGKEPPSGLGIFWNRDCFEPVAHNDPSIDGDNNQPAEMVCLDCNDEAFGGALVNTDLQEHWHSTKQQQQQQQQAELMKTADRRNVAIMRLRHRISGNVIVLCTAHLMTTSRDSSKTNRYPGEVRAGELAAIRSAVESSRVITKNDALLLVGDLNTDTKDCRSLFGGTIMASSGASDNLAPSLTFGTGFDPGTSKFHWGNCYILTDVFADVHAYGQGVGDGKYCTSRNAQRVEWIDYILYDDSKLDSTGSKSILNTPPKMMPDEEHPSDHLPVYATFAFKDE